MKLDKKINNKKYWLKNLRKYKIGNFKRHFEGENVAIFLTRFEKARFDTRPAYNCSLFW
jgi:hypothetical protein